MNPKIEVYPIFSSPLVITELDEQLEISNHLDKYDDLRFSQDQSKCLDDYPEDKEKLLNRFYEYATEILGLDDQKFKISTSWITKTHEYGHQGGFHVHKNSFYSGVFYFNEGDGFAPIIFDNLPFDRHHFFVAKKDLSKGDPVISNVVHMFSPKKNFLLLFPSYLSHCIGRHESTEIRFSLAFNIVPEGTIGRHDSTVTLN